MKNTMNKIEAKNSIMLLFSDPAWGNRAIADKGKIQTKAQKRLLTVSKKLIESSEYRDVLNYQGEVRKWLARKAVPTFQIRSTYLFDAALVEMVEKYLAEAVKKLSEVMKPLCSVYEKKMKDAEDALGDQFSRKDYPTLEELKNSFRFEWRWITFGVPDTLPEKIYKAEQAKAEALWKEATEQISLCLRKSFIDLISHANKILEPDANGRQKGWKNSSFENISEFINTFKNRNLVNDTELEKLVVQAKKVLSTVDDPQELKKDDEMRGIIQKNFTEITKKLDKMVQTKPSRKFDLE